MDEHFYDWQDSNWFELAESFAEENEISANKALDYARDKDGLFHDWCIEKYNKLYSIK